MPTGESSARRFISMRKIFTLSLLLAATAASARQISPDEALSAANAFLNSTSLTPVEASGAMTRSDAQPYYAFNATDGNGFVIISGDDRFSKVLGYSDRGSFDFKNMPPQLKAMLDQFAENSAKPSNPSNAHPSWAASTLSTRAEEGILLETANWGQGAPYNDLCPTVEGKKAPAGCVATAMAIVMKYHQWPETYNWEAMPMEIEYDGEIPPAANPELGRLMKDAGDAVCMEYGPTESEALFGWIGAQMRSVFGYSPDSQYITPSHFTDDKWLNIINSNIDNRNPVIYCGGGTGNHAFIIDGYKSDTYHVNWGWDGYCNGYFSLKALIPNDVQDFSNSIGMAINLEPNLTGKKYSECFVDCGYLGGVISAKGLPMNISVENIKKGEKFNVSLVSFIKPEGFTGEIGLAIVSKDEEIKEILGTQELYNSFASSSTLDFTDLTVTTDILPTDRLQIVTKRDTENEYKLVVGTLEKSSYISVVGNTPIFTNIKCDVEEGIRFNLFWGFGYDDTTIRVPSGQSDINSIIKGQYLNYHCSFDNPTEENTISNKIICLSLTSNSGWNDHRRSGTDIYGYSFAYSDDYYEFKVCSVELCDKSIDVTQPGSIESLIPEDSAIAIRNLIINGPIDSNDLLYINSHFPSLKSLDLGKTRIVDLLNEDGFVVAQSNTFPSFTMKGDNLTNLETLILPESLERFEDYSLISFSKLTSITIPKGVKDFGKETFYYTGNLDTICLLNPEPVLIDTSVLRGTRCPENGTLYVPVGSADKYRQTPIWKDFKNIIEGDLPAGIEDITISNSEINNCDVYTIDGIRMLKNASKEEINRLPNGIYIFREGNRTRKVVVNN